MIKRVALISPYALSVPGGVQEQTLAMSRELSSRSLDVLVIAPDQKDNFRYDTPAEVVKFGSMLSLPANGSKAPLTLQRRASAQAFEQICSFNPDVVHFHEPFAPLIGWRTLVRHRFPAVATIHRSGMGPAITLTTPVTRRLARGIDAWVAVSQMAAGTYRKSLPSEPRILFNGFEMNRFVAFERLTPTTPVFLAIGRLEERKGLEFAIRALRAHNEKSQDQWALRIIGDGPERARLVEIASGDANVTFLGRVDDETKRKEIRRCSALVAPSLYGESFGLILLEGMASEVPVVASDIDGYRQAAGGHAYLARAGDIEGLEGAMQAAIEGTSAAKLQSALLYAHKWSMKSLVDSYIEIYEQAATTFRAL